MKKLLLHTMTMLLLPLARGQQPIVFDTVRFNAVSSFAIGFSVFPSDYGYLVFSNQKGMPGLSQDLYTTRFDQTGGLLSEQSIETYQQDDWGSSSPVVKSGEEFYVASTRFGVLGPIDSLYLYKFDGDGDTLWSKFLEADTSWVQRSTTITDDGDVLLAGSHYPPDEAYVLRLDNSGNIKSYHGYGGFDGEDVVEGADGKCFVCGSGNQLNNYSHGVLLRSDTTGQQVWRHTDLDMYSAYYSMIALRDSGVVALGTRGSADSAGYAHAIKLRANGSVAWSIQPWQSSYHNWQCLFTCGYEDPDSTLIIAGWDRDTVNRDAGMLFKLDKEGNTIWKRFYSHYPGAAYHKDQIFWDVKPTSDGGMVLTGETNSDDYPYAQLWLLKLDSMGCLVEGCGNVGVDQYLDVLQPFLRVSPNPANDVFTLSLELPEGTALTGEVQAMLLDAQGKLVVQQTVQQHLNQLRGSMDVRSLALGTYYLHLRDAKRWLAGAKVVVE